MLNSIELEGDEVRPTLQLTPEDIARLEQEKHDILLGGISRKSDAVTIRGEGSALVEDRPALRPVRIVREDPVVPPPAPTQAAKITADPAVLMRLMTAAKQASEEAETARILCDTAEAEAIATREAMQDYMREHGLA